MEQTQSVNTVKAPTDSTCWASATHTLLREIHHASQTRDRGIK